MGVVVHLDVQGKAILILGGGRVALRKATFYLAQSALVSILSKEVLPEFRNLPVHILSDRYHKDILTDFFMVITCSDDCLCNQQVLRDANARQMLCMGVNGEQLANAHTMVSDDTGDFEIAVSTKGKVPALNKVVVKALRNYTQKRYSRRLLALHTLRDTLKAQVEGSKRQAIACYLADATEPMIYFMQEAIAKQEVLILCYHGAKGEEAQREIAAFQQRVAKKYPKKAITFAFLAKRVCDDMNALEKQVFPLTELLELLKGLPNMLCELYPMLLQEGRYYEQLCQWRNQAFVQVHPLPLQTLEEMQILVDGVYDRYHAMGYLLILYHSSVQGEFARRAKRLETRYANLQFLHEKQIKEPLLFQHQSLVIFSLFILPGMHMHQDGDPASVWVQALRERGCHITCIQQACIREPFLSNFLLSKI